MLERLFRTAIVALGCSFAAVSPSTVQAAELTLLHNNDGESQLLNDSSAGSAVGGIGRFVTAVNAARRGKADRDVLVISSGDNFLASPELNATFETLQDTDPKNDVYYDARALNAIGYDAVVLGNHDFDFGPEFLARFIKAVDTTPFLAANLNFAGEPVLQALVESGRIRNSVTIARGDRRYGIVGVITDELRSISMPGNITVLEPAKAIMAEVKQLRATGVDKIILASHMQGLHSDRLLLDELERQSRDDAGFDVSEIDVIIAGGGNELLVNNTDALHGLGDAHGSYPLLIPTGGQHVPVVTTPGSYQYLGVLDIDFDTHGRVVRAHAQNRELSSSPAGNPVLVSTEFKDDPDTVDSVSAPVVRSVELLRQRVVGSSDIALDGRREHIRTRETNLGNLVADALLAAARQLDPSLNTRTLVAITNGGGIRNNSVLPAGPITEFHTYEILPFANLLAVTDSVSVADLKALMEHSLARLHEVRGQFAQISGFKIWYDPQRPPGERVQQMQVDGDNVVVGGQVVANHKLVLVTNSFLAGGGDNYPFSTLGLRFRTLPVTCQQALLRFITEALEGQVLASRYPEGTNSRMISSTP